MYINRLNLTDFRTFRNAEIEFLHPDRSFRQLNLPEPKLPNVNLLLGNNGFGKSALLKAIALTALGPAGRSAGIYAYSLVRREPDGSKSKAARHQPTEAVLEATFRTHEQDKDGYVPDEIESRVKVIRRGDLEEVDWDHHDDKSWEPIFSSSTDAFFFVGYGATRRVERKSNIDIGSRKSSSFVRAQRVQSIFEEAYSLIPLSGWLPVYRKDNPGRYSQVKNLINELMGSGHYTFNGEMEEGEYLFERNGLKIPFPALSDGYRAYLGWVGDLLYHLCITCPSGKKLVQNRGIVLVDEIDLHLHPKWQMTVLTTLARELPNVQFIVTSHSPLIVGSLEWVNIIMMSPGPDQTSHPKRLGQAVHGLDADQILLTDFFGLTSTRAAGKKRRLKDLTLQARKGDTDAARQLLEEMSQGTEEVG